ncbi:unnamed protein product [Pocillopora meandrina]|uniref:G-protein coupled receptors family 1 profile domain-containing protein n=1 Tax=Pocillopora meandrina TaxID=46732 RepID=A0AAU9WNN0_9CNID|nr:unnamed protein product [Pocillopora meandrina]
MSLGKEGTLPIWHELQERKTVTVVCETAIFALVMVLSLVGNLMVCYAVRRQPRLRRPNNYFIISLALTDISQALFTMPLSVVLLATGKWPFGTFLIRFAAISMISLTYISTFTMALMALNRYYKIVKPAKYQTLFTKKFIISSASAVWAVVIVNAVVSLFALGFPSFVHPAFAIPVTWFPMPISRSILVFISYLPYPVIVFCYWKIHRAVKMHNANVSWQSANVEDVRVSKVLFVTVAAFLGLWLPAQTLIVVSFRVTIPRQLALFATLLIFSSSFINPFIYSFMSRTFRDELKKCFVLRKKQSVGTESCQREAAPV